LKFNIVATRSTHPRSTVGGSCPEGNVRSRTKSAVMPLRPLLAVPRPPCRTSPLISAVIVHHLRRRLKALSCTAPYGYTRRSLSAQQEQQQQQQQPSSCKCLVFFGVHHLASSSLSASSHQLHRLSLSLSLQPLLCRRSVGIRKYCHPHTTLIDSPTIDNCIEPLCFYFNCSITSGAKQAPAEINVPYIWRYVCLSARISQYIRHISQFLPAGRRCV